MLYVVLCYTAVYPSDCPSLRPLNLVVVVMACTATVTPYSLQPKSLSLSSRSSSSLHSATPMLLRCLSNTVSLFFRSIVVVLVWLLLLVRFVLVMLVLATSAATRYNLDWRTLCTELTTAMALAVNWRPRRLPNDCSDWFLKSHLRSIAGKLLLLLLLLLNGRSGMLTRGLLCVRSGERRWAVTTRWRWSVLTAERTSSCRRVLSSDLPSSSLID